MPYQRDDTPATACLLVCDEEIYIGTCREPLSCPLPSQPHWYSAGGQGWPLPLLHRAHRRRYIKQISFAPVAPLSSTPNSQLPENIPFHRFRRSTCPHLLTPSARSRAPPYSRHSTERPHRSERVDNRLTFPPPRELPPPFVQRALLQGKAPPKNAM